MIKFLKSFTVSAAILLSLIAVLLYIGDSVPEMAWSQSKDACVHVTQQGKKIPDGCARVARGELRAERYIVK